MILRFAQVEPTTRCNFTCGFCAGRHMPQQDIALATFEAFIGQSEGLEHIELQGEGEPLLHPQFFELIACARRKFPRVQVSMITNGSLFTAENIDGLLHHGVTRIFVSMESADAATFQRIRGGKLERVRRGIASLLAERNARGLAIPVVGLALTVLKSTTRESARGISAFYRELGLDGGITVQPLQSMPQYSKLYPPEIADEMPGPHDLQQLGQDIQRDPAFVSALGQRRNSPGFYEYLYSSVDPKTRCPWLTNAIYVAAQGDLVPCCHTKDYAADRLGDVGSGLGIALERRAEMQRQLHEGQVPPACTGCPIARRIAQNAGT